MGAIIHFGTDGWRARLDGDFTEENVARVADAAARYWAQQAPGATVYVAFDTRPQADDFARVAAGAIAAHGLHVKLSDRYAPTPALSWSIAHDERACGGLMVTGSHNPFDYLGIKLRFADGGCGMPEQLDELELLIDPDAPEAAGPFEEVDMVTPYLDALCELVDADAIAAAHLRVVYDPMYGSARGYLPAVLGAMGVEVDEIHGAPCEGWDEMRPEPIEPWVDDCEQAVVERGAYAGLVSNGDADRVGAVDENGRYVSSHKIIALVLGHLVVNHGLSGRVVLSLSASTLVRRVARELGCRVSVKPIGFKHIYEEMRRGDVLIGGEGSGGVGVPGHFPERDGLLMILLLCELMAMTGNTLGELVAKLEDRFGALYYARRDLRVEAEVIETLRTMLPGVNPRAVAGQEPCRVSHMDGLRLEFEDESWLQVRPGGTEPVVRVYAEASTIERRDELIEAGCDIARGEFL